MYEGRLELLQQIVRLLDPCTAVSWGVRGAVPLRSQHGCPQPVGLLKGVRSVHSGETFRGGFSDLLSSVVELVHHSQ